MTHPARFARRLLALALAASPVACMPEAQVRTAPELPVVKVVLYQNGVGYFERRGKLNGQSVELRVRPDQINDVLKSLSVLDLSGGMPSSVSLPVEKSGDRLAAELPAQVRNAVGLQGLLAVLRGTEVEVDGEDGTLQGRVVGVETQMVPGGRDGANVQRAVLTLMAGSDRLIATAVDGIREVRIGDRTLSVGLSRSLDISRSDGAWKPVSLTVRLAGDETHDLIVSYIHEVPIWRPAYRAWVETGKSVQLQGWAIVDNTSGEPWNDVDLTLVVGSPLSFRYNLHTPHHVQRPDLTSRLPQTADAPPEPDSGYAEAPPSPPAAMEAESREEADGLGDDEDYGGGGARSSKGAKDSARPRKSAAKPSPSYGGASAPSAGPRYAPKPPPAPEEQERRRDAMMRSAQALVTGKEVGALYTYQATTPVTVPDRAAALINIVNRKVDGQDVFLFREPQSGQAPFRAVMLRNATVGDSDGSALEGGPITLYVDGTFAGEGFIGRIAKNETAFIPYARESGFVLHLRQDQKIEDLHLVRIVDGRISIQAKRVYRRTVALESQRDKESVAYVKLPLTSGTTLQDPPKEMVKAGNEIYVPVKVGAKAKVEVVLVESTPIEMTETGLSANTLSAFRYYLKGQKVEDAVAGPIRELLALAEEQARLATDSHNLNNQRHILDQEQARIQNNLDALPAGAVADKLRKQLVGQLEGAAKKAAEVANKLVENEVKQAALNEKVVVLLRGISLK